MVYLVASMMCIGAISGLSSQQTVPSWVSGVELDCGENGWCVDVKQRESSLTWWETHIASYSINNVSYGDFLKWGYPNMDGL